MTAQLRREFGRGYKLHAQLATRLAHALAALHRVMVRQCHRLESASSCMPCQFFRRVCAVGKIRVQMQVGEHFYFTSLAGRISSFFTLSRIPLTNRPLSSVLKRLAMSTASLMLITGG